MLSLLTWPLLDKGLSSLETPAPHPLPSGSPLLPPPQPLFAQVVVQHVARQVARVQHVVPAVQVAEEVVLPWSTAKTSRTTKCDRGVGKSILLRKGKLGDKIHSCDNEDGDVYLMVGVPLTHPPS